MADLTQQQLAELVDVRRETIAMLETGKCDPSMSLARKIADLLGVSISDLTEEAQPAAAPSSEVA